MRSVLRAAVVAAALALPAAANADTTVDPASTGTCARNGTCKTIQEAVTAAQESDAIVVKPGSYTENVTIPAGKNGLTIKGADAGVAVTGGFTVSSNNVTLFKMAVARSSGNDPAVTVNGTGAQLVEMTVVSVAGNAVQVTGGANIQRSLVAAPAGDALHAEITSGDAHVVKASSSVLVGGPAGAGVNVTATGATAGATTLALRHITTPASSGYGLRLDNSGAVGVLNPAGNITATIDGSILHGAKGSTARNFVTPLELGARSNVIDVTFTNNDANDMVATSKPLLGNDSSGDPKGPHVVVNAQTLTSDSALFDAKFRLLAGSPAIDKGGAVNADESQTDIDGEPRTTGAASDLGADEYLNKAPEAKGVTLTPPSPKSGQVVTVNVDATDANAGDVLTYGFDWGDGTQKQTAQSPAAQHLYAKPGTYTLTAVVVDSAGAFSNVVQQQVNVVDGVAPSVKITSKKLLVKRHELRVRGAVSDSTGVASVEIALTRSAGCRQYTTSGFVRTPAAQCASQRKFVPAQLIGGTRFEITTNPDVKIPKGKYVLRARATDKAGNVSTKFTTKAGSLVRLSVK